MEASDWRPEGSGWGGCVDCSTNITPDTNVTIGIDNPDDFFNEWEPKHPNKVPPWQEVGTFQWANTLHFPCHLCSSLQSSLAINVSIAFFFLMGPSRVASYSEGSFLMKMYGNWALMGQWQVSFPKGRAAFPEI